MTSNSILLNPPAGDGHLNAAEAAHMATGQATLSGWTATPGATVTVQVVGDYSFAIDDFKVTKGASTIFDDGMSLAPPTSDGALNGSAKVAGIDEFYSTKGAFTGGGDGRVLMTAAGSNAGAAYDQAAVLETNTDPGSTAGLKKGTSFSANGVFSLTTPALAGQAYGILFTDKTESQVATDVVELLVGMTANGTLAVTLREMDNGVATVLATTPVDAPMGTAAIALKLQHSGSASDDTGAVDASFTYLDAKGVSLGESTLGTATIFETVTYTRAGFFAVSPSFALTTQADADGNWSVNVPAATSLTDGSYVVSASSGDGTMSTPLVVDLTAPAAPTLMLVGSIDGTPYRLTTDASLVGTADPGATVTIREGGRTLAWTQADGSGAWSIAGSALPLGDGEHDLTAVATDVAGNVSIASPMLDFVLDTQLAAPAMMEQTIPNYMAVPGSATQWSVSHQVDAAGSTWVFCGDGANASNGAGFTAYLAATNQPPIINAIMPMVAGPTVPTVSLILPDLPAADMTQRAVDIVALANGGWDVIWNDSSLGANFVSTYGADGTPLSGENIPDLPGWTRMPAATEILTGPDQTRTGVWVDIVPDGGAATSSAMLSVMTQGSTGSTAVSFASAASIDVHGIKAAVAADGSTIVAVAWDTADEAGGSLTDNQIDLWRFDANGSPTFLATRFGRLATTSGDDLRLSDLQLLGDGTVLVAVDRDLLDGGHQIELLRYDLTSGALLGESGLGFTGGQDAFAGLTVNADGTVLVTYLADGAYGSTMPFLYEQTLAVPQALRLVNDSGISSSDGLTNDASLTGATEPGATVEITVDGTPFTSVIADATGTWTFDATLFPGQIADGTHTLTATPTDAAGHVGTTSSIDITLDTTVPWTWDEKGMVSVFGTGVFGSPQPDMTVSIADTSQLRGAVTVQADGTMLFEPGNVFDGLGTGGYDFTSFGYTLTDAAGNTSPVVYVSIGIEGPPAPDVELYLAHSATYDAIAGGFTITDRVKSLVVFKDTLLADPAITGIAVIDDTANIVSQIDTLAQLPIVSVTTNDAPVLMVENAARMRAIIAADANVLAAFTSGYSFQVTTANADGSTSVASYDAAGTPTENVVTGITGQPFDASDTLYGANGKPTITTWTNNGAVYQVATYDAEGTVHDIRGYTGGTFWGIAFASWLYDYAGGVRTQQSFFDGSGIVVASQSWNADGSRRDIHGHTGGTFQGVAYASWDNLYRSDLRDRQNFLDADGKMVASQTFAADGSVKDVHIYSGGTFWGIGFASWIYDYAGGVRTQQSFLDGSGAIVASQSWNADGSRRDIHGHTGGTIQGVTYASWDNFYTGGSLDHETFLDADGKVVASQTFNADGSLQGIHVYAGGTFWGIGFASWSYDYVGGAITQQSFLDGNGSVVASQSWNADGSRHDIHGYTAGTFQGVAYASWDNFYAGGLRNREDFLDGTGKVVASETFAADGSYAIYIGGVLKQQKTVHADGTWNFLTAGITGQSFTEDDIHYAADGKKLSETWSNGGVPLNTKTYNADGSVHDVRIYGAGTFWGLAYASRDVSYTNGFVDLQTFLDAGGNEVARQTFVSDGSNAVYLGGTLKQQKSVNADGTWQLELKAAGSFYDQTDVIYRASGKAETEVWSKNGAAVRVENWNADGTVANDTALNGTPTAVAPFGGRSSIDLFAFAPGSATLGFTEDASNTFGVLSLTQGKDHLGLALMGQYAASDFMLAADGFGGSLVSLTPAAVALLAGAHG